MLTNRIYEWARKQPEKIALVIDGRPVRYAEFARGIAVTRHFLAAKNLPVGGLAIVRAHTIGDAWVVVLALRSLGLTTIYPRTAQMTAELGLKNVSCVVTTEVAYRAEAKEHPLFPGMDPIVVPEDIYEPSLPPVPFDIPNAPRYGDHILYTSGTTGSYKMVLRSGEKVGAVAEFSGAVAGVDANTVYHSLNLGVWTVAGYDVPTVNWWLGGTMIFDTTPKVFENFFKFGATHGLVPSGMVKNLIDANPSRTVSGRKFHLDTGGGFLPFDLAVAARERLFVDLCMRYGSTECATMIMTTPIHTQEDLYWYVPPIKRNVEIVDDNGREVPPGIEGELRMPLIDLDSTYYIGDPEATAKFFRDNCFYPGDRAVKRADGRIRILGRTDDVLNVQGVKIASAPLEQEMENLLGAHSVCLFTGFDRAGNEVVGIAIETDRAVPSSEIQNAIDKIGVPGQMRVVVLPQFPRTTAGMNKVDRKKLKEIVFEN